MLSLTDAIPQYQPSFFAPKKVKVPIYTTAWKIKCLQYLQEKCYSPEEIELSTWKPRRDFSKLIWPDQWITYRLKQPIAIPKYVEEYNYFGVINPMHEFFQEDLSYGIRPMRIYNALINIGGGVLFFIHKSDNSIYKIIGSEVILLNHIQDFKNFLQQKDTLIDWEQRQIG